MFPCKYSFFLNGYLFSIKCTVHMIMLLFDRMVDSFALTLFKKSYILLKYIPVAENSFLPLQDSHHHANFLSQINPVLENVGCLQRMKNPYGIVRTELLDNVEKLQHVIRFVCLVGFLTSSSASRLYRGRVPRLTSDNFTCCHTRDRAGRP